MKKSFLSRGLIGLAGLSFALPAIIVSCASSTKLDAYTNELGNLLEKWEELIEIKIKKDYLGNTPDKSIGLIDFFNTNPVTDIFEILPSQKALDWNAKVDADNSLTLREKSLVKITKLDLVSVVVPSLDKDKFDPNNPEKLELNLDLSNGKITKKVRQEFVLPTDLKLKTFDRTNLEISNFTQQDFWKTAINRHIETNNIKSDNIKADNLKFQIEQNDFDDNIKYLWQNNMYVFYEGTDEELSPDNVRQVDLVVYFADKSDPNPTNPAKYFWTKITGVAIKNPQTF